MRIHAFVHRGGFALGVLLTVITLTAAVSAPGPVKAQPMPSTQDATNGSVANAKMMLGTGSPDSPGQAQQAQLAKPSLTHTDYELAMRAMASCIEERVPGAKFELRPSKADPRTFDTTYSYEGPATVAPERESDSGKPANLIANDRIVAQCRLSYSAYVEDRWMEQLHAMGQLHD